MIPLEPADSVCIHAFIGVTTHLEWTDRYNMVHVI